MNKVDENIKEKQKQQKKEIRIYTANIKTKKRM